MSSYQNAAPGSKSMKFADALNPFAPFLANPVRVASRRVVSCRNPVMTSQRDL
jgi:hypothetical protein